jgi:hypothetical protein
MVFSEVRVSQSSIFRVVVCPSFSVLQTKIEKILTIDLSFPDIETDMEIFDNISSTRRCLASQNNINVVTDCSSTYNFSCEGSGMLLHIDGKLISSLSFYKSVIFNRLTL